MILDISTLGQWLTGCSQVTLVHSPRTIREILTEHKYSLSQHALQIGLGLKLLHLA